MITFEPNDKKLLGKCIIMGVCGKKQQYFTVKRLFYIFVVILISNRNISKGILLI